MTSRTRAAIALCAAAGLTLSACSSSPKDDSTAASSSTAKTSAMAKDTNKDASKGADKDTSDSTPVKVVATTTQICDYVTQIAKDDSATPKLAFVKTDSSGKTTEYGAPVDKAQSQLDLTCLLAPNASAHNHEMTPQQMDALKNADLFLVSGVDLEHFLDKAVNSSGFKGTLAVTSGVLTSADIKDLKAEENKEKKLPFAIYRGVAKVKVEKWPFPPEAGEEPEFIYDPHVWTAPENAMVQVRNIGAALNQVSPANANLFDAHVARYEKQLSSLDEWAKKSLDSVPKDHRVLFTSHDAFGYFSKEYGIKFVGSALTDFNEQADATADHIASEAQKVKDSGANALFAENSNSAKSIEAIAKAAGVKAVLGDDALYGDSLGPDGSDGETYIGSILHNVSNLTKAWGGTVAPIPADLEKFAPKHLEN